MGKRLPPNGEGCPVAIEVFAGNTGDPTTVASQVTKLQKRFELKRIILVGDRGMITDARIREDLSKVEGLDWITALRAPAIAALVECSRARWLMAIRPGSVMGIARGELGLSLA
jgi:hypothetical protein